MANTEGVEVALAADRNYYCAMAVAACSIAQYCKPDVGVRFDLLFSGFTEDDRLEMWSRLQNLPHAR